MKTLAIFFILVTPIILFAGPLENLQPGHWYEAPSSNLGAVAPDAYSVRPVMSAWSGGAYDSKRDRLIVWGGGHGDYSGNEVYVFDINTLQWDRLTDPSSNTGGDETTGLYPDGLPRSRHTYNYIEYLPNADRFITLGGSGMYPSGQITCQTVSAFDFDNLTWNSSLASGGGGIGTACAYDPKTGLVFHHSSGSSGKLSSYNAAADEWKIYNARPNRNIDYALAIDPDRHIMVVFDGYGSSVAPVDLWDLDNPDNSPVVITTTGDKAPETPREGAEGFEYDPVSRKFVAWIGGPEVYTLSPPQGATTFAELAAGIWTWEKVSPAQGNSVTPTARTSNGIYGRFRYVPSKNVFVLVNSTEENVFFYRLTAGSGAVDTGKSKDSGPNIRILPNPFNSIVEIHVRGQKTEDRGQTARIIILDISGKVVYQLTSDL